MRVQPLVLLAVLLAGCSTDTSDNATASGTEGSSPPAQAGGSGLLSEITPTYTSSGCKMFSDTAKTKLVGELSSSNVDKSTSKIHTNWRIGVKGSVEEDFFVFNPGTSSDRSTQTTPSMTIAGLDQFPGQICSISGGCGSYSGSGTLVINDGPPDKIIVTCG